MYGGLVYKANNAKELQRSYRGISLTDKDKVKEACGLKELERGGLDRLAQWCGRLLQQAGHGVLSERANPLLCEGHMKASSHALRTRRERRGKSKERKRGESES